jgi:ATP-dependent exoDNAse (exonuclease V) alpha subunit
MMPFSPRLTLRPNSFHERIPAALVARRALIGYEFNPSDYRHLDHGYVVTSHSSQGLHCGTRVLVPADTGVHPDLLNSRFGYVSISCASHEATLFTNDLAKLAPQIGADVSKTSALEINHTSCVSQAIGVGL